MKALQNLKSADWWAASLIRALRTAAQTAIASLGTTALLTEVNWAVIGSTVGMAVVLSILTSIAGLPETKKDG